MRDQDPHNDGTIVLAPVVVGVVAGNPFDHPRHREHELILQNHIMALAGTVFLVGQALAQSTRPGRAVLDVQMITPDSMAVQVVQPQCGILRLVLVGSPQRIPMEPGIYQPTRRFELSVALENSGRTSLPVPVRMTVDSAVPIQRGRQLSRFYIRNYVGFEFWDGRRIQQPWEFTSTLPGDSLLKPGKRSGIRVLKMNTEPLAQAFRIWFRIQGPGPMPPYAPLPEARRQRIADTLPLGPDVDRFIAAARFPELRSKKGIYRDASRNLLIFGVSYGSPQDCPSGCFYSGAVGLKYGSRIGWLDHDNYDRNDSLKVQIQGSMFPTASLDAYLLSEEFTDSLRAQLGSFSPLVDQVILPLVLHSPNVPRARLLHYTESLYGEVQQWLANLLVGIPKVNEDPDLLTLLANLPEGGPPYASTAAAAGERLRKMAPGLLRDPQLSTRTLFLLVRDVPRYLEPRESEPALLPVLIAHPKVRNDPTFLAVLWQFRPELLPQLLASVHAPDSAKKLLNRYLVRGRPDSTAAWALLRDPATGSNPDILAVLANAETGDSQEIMWAASRRLPEEALRSREPPNIPLH
jgi:hypothetical protein